MPAFSEPVTSTEFVFAGLDGCRSGWVLALLGQLGLDVRPAAEGPATHWSAMVFDLALALPTRPGSPSGPQPGAAVADDPATPSTPARLVLSWHSTLAGAVAVAAGAGAGGIGIDMPIGLAQDGHRPADDAARSLLGRRRSTLFPTPARTVLDAVDFSDALVRSRAVSGKGISIQAWNLLPKIREVDQWVTPEHVERVFEVHPELAFARLARNVVPADPKRSSAGRAVRLALLDERLGLGSTAVAHLQHQRPGPGMGLDDVLDAVAVACSCERLLSGNGVVLGGGERDQRGLTMRVCF